jgi:CPA2 family monovalent cation:H+ antiporter-2
MHESELILTLTGALAAALVLGFLTQKIGLSPIVGYLLAGLAVGPYTPGFVANQRLTGGLAELGILLLMFGVGLHFHIKDLLAVRNIAIAGALCQSAIATALGTALTRGLGWSWGSGVVFGLALSVASTVVLTRILVDNNDLHTPTGRIAMGWLVVEDIFTVLVLVLLPAIFSSPSGTNTEVLPVLGLALAKIGLLIVLAFVLGVRLIPRILNAVARTHSRELFTLTILVVTLGIAVGSAKLFGASMALGAFLAGMIVAQSEFSFRAASEALPMRDAFAVLFFVSVGMLFDPLELTRSIGLFAATSAIVLLGKPLAAFLITTLFGYGWRIALGISVALAQIGEFSLILATVADELSIFPPNATNALIGATMVSITLNPVLYRMIRPFSAASLSETAVKDRTIVVGYGPIGRMLARLLHDRGIEPVIIETNHDTIRQVTNDGYRAIYGDATQKETLDSAGIETAIGLVISGPTPQQVADIVRLARAVNPSFHVLVRSHYLRDVEALREAGATRVFSGEGEVALAMTEHILMELGATPEQLDRERQKVRDEVFRRPEVEL